VKDFRRLKVWRKAHELTLAVYHHSSGFPKEERYGLTSQLRKSAASVATNIAEGCGRGGDVELARFLRIAMGSASEVEYQLILAHDLLYVDPAVHAQLPNGIAEVKQMLTALMRRLSSLPPLGKTGRAGELKAES